MQRLTGYHRIVLKKWPLDEYVVVVVWCSFQDLLFGRVSVKLIFTSSP